MLGGTEMLVEKGRATLRFWRSTPSRLYPHLCVLLGYTLLTLLFTYPMVLHMGSRLIGVGGDGWQNVWNLWWTKKALLDLHTNPFHTDYLYYPQGTSLYFHTLNIFNGFLSIPLQDMFGLIFSYNTIVLFSFVFGGYGAYLLTHYLVRNRTAAFISGMVFTFSPYHLAHTLGHMQLIALEWLPFFVLFLIRTVEERSSRNALCAAFFLFLTSLCDWYYVMYLLLFTLLTAVYYLWTSKNREAARDITVRLVLTGIIFVVLDAPILLPMLSEARSERYMITSLESSIAFSADLLSFFVPAQSHPIWGKQVVGWRDKFAEGYVENTVFMGYTALVLGLLGAWKKRPKSRFWLYSLAFFFIMALGPILHINGQTRFTDYQLPIVLPYALFYSIVPFVKAARSVSRMSVMVMLSLAVLVGLGLSWLLSTTGDKRLWGKLSWSDITAVLAAFLIGFEFLSIPFPMAQPDQVPAFYRTLAEDPGEYAVLDLPNVANPALGRISLRYMAYQTVHNKPMFGGDVARDPWYPLGDTAILRYLLRPRDEQPPDIIHRLDVRSLSPLGFKYIVVHKSLLAKSDYGIIRQRLAALFYPDEPFWEDKEVLVYRLPEKVESVSLLVSEPIPQFPLNVNFANQVELLGYELSRAGTTAQGTEFYITYHWKCLEKMTKDYTIFVHITDIDGKKVVAQQDHRPAYGTHPTTQWEKGELIEESYNFWVSPDVPKGKYAIRVGLWLPADKTMLEVVSSPNSVDWDGHRALIGYVEIE